MAKPEHLLACAAGIGIVLPDAQGALMMEQSVQNVESGRFRGVCRLRLMRAVTVRLAGLSLHSPHGPFLMNADPRESPALSEYVPRKVSR